MCGIAGFVVSGQSPETPEHVLRRMTRTLAHRGPDDEGFHVQNGVFLGHRRLSIIDLASGHQPLYNEDNVITTVFNGEVYNYIELISELKACGHTFRTHSDTEVLVHGYESWDTGLFRRLNGMFAFAIWDDRRKRLVLARDRMGKKPLYYAETKDGLVFGSELKALLVHPWISRNIDLGSLRKYLLFDYVPSPASILTAVKKLPAGWYLEWQNGQIRACQPYWDIRFPEAPQQSEADLAQTLWELLMDSVRLRLRSDVPLGVFLSGGIDSSCVVALMAAQMPPDRIHTFSIGFKDKSFDESSYARLVANHFGTQHHERILEPETMLEMIPGILKTLDEPMADASLIPTYLLSAFTREHVTVALGGDGGDELFLGYPTFLAHKIATFLRHLPKQVTTSLLPKLASQLPVSTNNISFDYKVKRLLLGAQFGPLNSHFVWIGAFDPIRQQSLLTNDVLDSTKDLDLFEDVEQHRLRLVARDDFDTLSYLYSKLYMGDDILVKVDRATMAHALEARAPLLDYRVVEFAAALPTRLKLRGWTMKYLLKKMLRNRLPNAVLDRPKKGFGIPIAEWLKGPLLSWAKDLLSASELNRDRFFRPEYVEMLFQEHLSGRADHRKLLWSLIIFQLWQRNYGTSTI
ncbi:MAG: asparagine synthase (glutamine-hydrolyzing) [Myxococcales bacterium]|nr:asparagine synthase (glutamine-hydrolyzing) [Myxococcales bacterium]